jgi:Ca2+-binding RTX toxin-like protein
MAIINGTNGPDTLTGTSGDDTINGLGGDDRLIGGAGGNLLNGGDGNDVLDNSDAVGISVLEGGAGADHLIGSSHFIFFQESASYAGSAAGVTVNLGTGTASGGDAEGDTFTRISNLIGSAHDDVLTSGNGGPQGSNLLGGAGNDTLSLGTNGGYMEGGAGADRLIGDSAVGQVAVIYDHSSSGVTVNLTTGTGSGGEAEGDVLSGIDVVSGSAYGDVLTSGAGKDELYGKGGDDMLRGVGGSHFLDGGDGVDTADYSHSAFGVTVNLVSGTGLGGDAHGNQLVNIENLIGTDRSDSLTGNAGANVLDGGAGADLLAGGDGYDTVTYARSAAAVTVSLTTAAALGGDAQGDVLSGIEGLIGSAFNDTLAGSSGNDTLEGGAGADTLYGSQGNDTASYASSATGVQVNLATGGVVTGGDATGDFLNSIESLIGSAHDDVLGGINSNSQLSGGAGNDVLTGGGSLDGGTGDDVLRGDGVMNGGDGQDTLIGSDRDNTLLGGNGDDQLTGGEGADILDGGAGFDRASYIDSPLAVTINLLLGIASAGDAQDDSLISIEAIYGSRYADTMVGDASNNTFYGGGGNDTLSGGAGGDTLIGGIGADRLDGGAGVDTAYYLGGAVAVQIDLGAGTASGGDAAGDTLTGIEQVSGTAFNDVLTGNAGANRMWGNAGDDVITGGGGIDNLKGGAGNDRFVYLAPSDAANVAAPETIEDFTTGDKVDLSAIDANGSGAGNTAFTFISGAFSGTAGELRVTPAANGFQLVTGDINGDKVADFAIAVLSDHALTAADFVL